MVLVIHLKKVHNTSFDISCLKYFLKGGKITFNCMIKSKLEFRPRLTAKVMPVQDLCDTQILSYGGVELSTTEMGVRCLIT